MSKSFFRLQNISTAHYQNSNLHFEISRLGLFNNISNLIISSKVILLENISWTLQYLKHGIIQLSLWSHISQLQNIFNIPLSSSGNLYKISTWCLFNYLLNLIKANHPLLQNISSALYQSSDPLSEISSLGLFNYISNLIKAEEFFYKSHGN